MHQELKENQGTAQFVHPSFAHLRLSLSPFVVVVICSSRAGTSDFFPAVSLTSVMGLGTELTFIRCLKKHLSACCVLNHCQYLVGKDLIFPLPSDQSKLDAGSCIRELFFKGHLKKQTDTQL